MSPAQEELPTAQSLKELRIARNLSLNAVADAAGIRATRLYAIEHAGPGVRPTAEELQRIQVALDGL